VLDLRLNSGGFDEVAFEIASRLADEPRVVFTRHAGQEPSAPYEVTLQPSPRRRLSGPVAVLIGPQTVSAGEVLAQCLAAQPHARLFGQPTRGILSDAIPKALPNGWTYTLSVETLRAPSGEPLEVRGVLPHAPSPPPSEASPEAMWGEELRRAAAWLAQPG
jgi:carboxyl-terminal processing protease